MSTTERPEPIEGPLYGTPDWDAFRSHGIFASEAAEACGLSQYGQPLDLYLYKRGLVDAFAGNEFTRRGKRFEPFIAQEYEEATGEPLITNLPTFMHPVLPHIGATPDAVRENNPRHGVEFKACGWRRAAALGEPGSDDIFPDWLCQVQQQMSVMDWDRCDVFVMVDLHSYRSFTVERNEALIERIIAIESDLWQRVLEGNPPPPDFKHPLALELIQSMFSSVEAESAATLSASAADAWQRVVDLNDEIREREKQRDALKAEVLFEMGSSAYGALPGGRILGRTAVASSVWTEDDVKAAAAKLGTVKRKGYVKLTERTKSSK